MIITTGNSNELSFEEARVFVRNELARLVAAPVAAEHYPLVIRIEVPLVPFSALDWLAHQDVLPRSYWGDPEGPAEYAGVGAAWDDFARTWGDSEELWDGLDGLLSAEPELRVCAGMCFNRVLTGAEWRSFKGIRFFIPRFEIIADGRGTRLVCNLILGEGERLPLRHLLRELEALRVEETVTVPRLQVVSRHSTPNFEEWSSAVAAALADIESGVLDKAVLSRRVTINFDGPVDPVVLLRRLLEIPDGGYAFFYQFSETHAFLGVSPELLYARSGEMLSSEAVAGTRTRGDNLHEDAELGRELLGSEQDVREHRSVIGALVAVFRQVCRSYKVEEKASVRKLARQQHLVTRISGKLAEGVTDRDLCSALHPTPAVGGSPADKAMQFLNHVESFDRGWFAAPVGYFQKSSARLAVAIRSCLAAGDAVHLYSGAGIVDGSRPLAEWDEMEIKIKQYLDIFYDL
ncbi:MAG: isochorismate synthase [Candidatus Omnitrophica bacterium]|nr:isochorismate synthase [Candidatus Omnitrophota bacterium]